MKMMKFSPGDIFRLYSNIIVECCSLPADWCSGRPPVSSSPGYHHGADITVCLLLSTLSIKEGVSVMVYNIEA